MRDIEGGLTTLLGHECGLSPEAIHKLVKGTWPLLQQIGLGGNHDGHIDAIAVSCVCKADWPNNPWHDMA